jgi:subtilase family serine protease
VANIGASEADNFLVAFYNGTHLIERKVVARLEPGASVDLSVDWVPQETGSEVLKVKVDSGNSTPEINESNNLVKATVNVQETFGTQFAIPIILLIGVTGYGVFKLYQWLSFRRLTRRK